ncbi:MAG: hypothetical protein V4727_03730 [Verrucomicrobiota bacterium]
MLRIITILLFGTASLCADGFIYTSDDDHKYSKSLENGELVMRAPLKKVDITHVVLKEDPNTKGEYWISFHMKQAKRIGLFYYFKPMDDMKLNEPFFKSPSEFHKEGCSWAINIKSLENGRTILELVRDAYKLQNDFAIDRTKG